VSLTDRHEIRRVEELADGDLVPQRPLAHGPCLAVQHRRLFAREFHVSDPIASLMGS
jgi:hypothetical protein